MALADCIAEIRAAAGDDLTDEDIGAIWDDIQRRARAKKAKDGLLNDQEALDAAAKDFATDADLAARMEARNRALNVLARKRVSEFIDMAVGKGVRADKAFEALVTGNNIKLPGGRLSVDARQQALFKEFAGGLIADLERAGLLEYMTRRLGLLGRDAGVADRDIARALWSIGENGKVTADVPGEIAKIAEIINKWQEAARLRSNRAGSFIRRMEGYIVRQSHDSIEIRKAGRQAWIDAIRPLLDADRTFGGSDPEKFLSSTYDALASGIHIKSQGAVDDLAFKGPANLAKRASQERILHFKDADSWLAYNEKFGTRSLIESVFGGLERTARDIGLMETFGTNPRAMFDDMRAAKAFSYRDTHPEWGQALRAKWLDNRFDEVDGTTRLVDNASIAQFSGFLRALQSMAKLGGAVISSITDVATAASELRYQGQNLGSAYTGLLANLVEGRSSREQRALAAEIGEGLDGALGAVAGRFTTHDDLPGTASKVMRLFFKANLLTWWTDSIKTGAGRMMAWRAGQQANFPWAKTDARFREVLSLYGIDEPKWEVMRKAAETLPENGKPYLTPAAIRALPDDAFKSLGGRAASQRDELATALQAFYSDRVDVAVVTPGARERSMMNQGTGRGTWMGESIRFLMQFKAFPLAFATKVIGRDLGGEGLVNGLLKGRGDLLGLAHTVAATTILGMISMQAKEILKGREPRDPFGDKWAGAWSAAFAQGGGLGIYGDFLFGETNRFGNDVLETAAGPTLTTASDVVAIWNRIRTGEDPSAASIRFVAGNTPFLNLFYTRAAMDYMILYQLQEAANPGYLRRMEQRLKRENDQEFILPPSEVIQ